MLIPNTRRAERGWVQLGSPFFHKPDDNENKMLSFWKGGIYWLYNQEMPRGSFMKAVRNEVTGWNHLR